MSTTLPGSFRDLPPKWAHFCLGVERFMKRELGVDPVNAEFLCAFSGGADSTALLLVLHCLSLKNGGKVYAAHLDHSLRPESGQERLWCESLCKQLGVPFRSERIDVGAVASRKRMGIEETGREVRYDFLKRSAEEFGAPWIATGHHSDDLSEDVVMRLARGSGWPALSGMPGVDAKRRLVRPLLMNTKETLKSFLTALDIEWMEDTSNADPAMMRNRVRNSIIPLLKEENPNFTDAIARLWRLGRIDEGYWDDLCPEPEEDVLPNSVLTKSHQALRLRMYKRYLDTLGKGQALADTLLKMDDAWRERRVGAVFQFPGDKTAKILRKGVLFGFKR